MMEAYKENELQEVAGLVCAPNWLLIWPLRKTGWLDHQSDLTLQFCPCREDICIAPMIPMKDNQVPGDYV